MSENTVVSYSIDRRVKRQLEKIATAAGTTPSAMLRFFLSKRCNAPETRATKKKTARK
jgi:antitoxin component of RelBE/YafQ-DinJ toxin-antitoxin module